MTGGCAGGVVPRSNNSSIGSYYQLEMCLKTSVYDVIEDCRYGVQRVRQRRII